MSDGVTAAAVDLLWREAADHHQAGRPGLADVLCDKILESQPDHLPALHLAAIIAFANKRVVDGIELIGRLFARDPDHVPAMVTLGDALTAQGQHRDAAAIFERAVALRPADLGLKAKLGAIYDSIGMALHQAGRLEDAIVYFRKEVELAPNDRPAQQKLALTLHAAGRLQDAVDAYRRFTALDAGNVEIYSNLGACLSDLGQFDAAAEACDRALALQPKHAKAQVNRGIIFERSNQVDAAIGMYRGAIAADPNEANGYANLAVALHNKGELDEALIVSRRAAALNPQHPLVQSNLAGVLHNIGNIDEALAVSHRAVALAPGHPMVRLAHSHLLLMSGDLERGFADYRWRHKCVQTPPELPGAQWRGEPFANRTLLLSAEQGLGDTMQFIRYLPMVAAKNGNLGGDIVLQVQPSLATLLQTLPDVTVVPRGAPLPHIDLHLPLLDLPYLFGTTRDTIPANVPYLHADAGKVEHWRRVLGNSAALKVGVVWAGSPTHKGDRYRSLAAETVLPRLKMPGVQLYSLQKELRPDDMAVLASLGADVIDLGPQLADFADTAAAVAALDLVISVDTSVAHLAGALGRPTWVLLPYAQDWRWMRDRADSPWYPSLRLFRQDQPRDWDGALARLTDELRRLGSTHTSHDR